MKHASDTDAFTRFELLAVVSTAIVIALVCVPLLANNAAQSDQVGCLNNLRQIGIAFQSWGSDHEDRKPWFVSTGEIGGGGSAGHPLRNNAWVQFSFLSNHLASPALFVDPGELNSRKRTAALWSFSPQGGFMHPNFGDNALSYMLGVHTTLAEADEILGGDRNVAFAGVSSGCSYGFAQVLTLGSGPEFRGWTNGPHGVAGNLLLNDGRVEYAHQQRLRTAIAGPLDFNSNEHFLSPLE